MKWSTVRIQTFPVFNLFLSFFLLLAVQFTAKAQFPLCFAQTGVCSDIPYHYYVGFCSDASAPTYCLCSYDYINPGESLNWLVGCHGQEERATQTNNETPPDMDKDKLCSTPFGVLLHPHDGAAKVSLSSEGYPLIKVRTTKTEASADKEMVRTQAKEAPSNVRLCKEKCKNEKQWSFRKSFDNEKIKQYHIVQLGKKERFLYRTMENEITFVSDTSRLTKEEKVGLEWLIGAGAFEDDDITAYRVLSAVNIMEGLGVDKKTGEVGVYPVFQIESVPSEKEGEDSSQKIALNTDVISLWDIQGEEKKEDTEEDKRNE